MDRTQHNQSITDPARTTAGQPGHHVHPDTVPGRPARPAAQGPLLLSTSAGHLKTPGLGPRRSAGPTATATEQGHPEQARCGSSPAPLASISRPRPASLGTRPQKASWAPDEPSKEKHSIPLRIPGPHSSAAPPQSPTESLLCLRSPPSPLSPQAFLSPRPQSNPNLPLSPNPNPNPNPPSNLCLRASPSPQPQRVPSPGGSTENHPQPVKTAGDSDDFRVYIVTWNVGSAVPPDDIISLFGPNVADGSVDMFVVGLQEVNSMINKLLKDALFTDQWSELCMDTLCPYGYVLVASQRMQGVLLLVFSKFCHLPFLREVQTESTRTGLGGYWGNKGGVSARMAVFGHPVCFLNCHLPAHMRNLEQRMEDFESILQQQQFEGRTATGVLDHDVVFWFGDLNFRIEDYDIHVVKCAIDSHKLPLLLERDQLNMAKNTESILEGFMEGPLHFPPTYKFDVGTNTYDTSTKKRKPAWTDRILWRLRRTGSPVPTHNAALQRGLTSWLGGATKVTQHEYHSHMGYTISDHKPVSALFSLQFPFKVDIALVELQVNGDWCKITDATVKFTTASTYQRGSWDWVAIYKTGFRHHKDYEAYIWVKEHMTQVTFPEEELPRDPGEYILGYYSNNMNSIVGMTSPIQIQIPVHSPTACRSESSDVSSEDDSTLVLLAPNSRSPSPKTGKHHHHHRHRHGHSPAMPALSSTSLPSLQGLSLRPKEAQTRSRSPCPAAKKERLVSPGSLSSPSITPLSPRSPRSPRSPISPGCRVTAPEALIVAILGEQRPRQSGKAGEMSP